MLHWLSFADAQGTGKNLGVCVVEADSFIGAVEKAHRLKINPGGEVQGATVDEMEGDMELDRLYSRDEMIDMGYGVSVKSRGGRLV